MSFDQSIKGEQCSIYGFRMMIYPLHMYLNGKIDEDSRSPWMFHHVVIRGYLGKEKPKSNVQTLLTDQSNVQNVFEQ